MTAKDDDWGFPAFAKEFPKDPELDALVAAFARGDYRAIKDRAPKLAVSASDEEVQRAARMLLERTRPDPATKILLLATAALLLVLTAFWITHDGPPEAEATPKTEHVP